MHRSGTSALARVLNLAGVYFGVEGVATPANAENSKGFWEREDVRALNDAILHSTRCDWDAVANFDISAVPRQDRATVERGVREVVAKLDAHRPWFIKEPRLCLTLPLWRQPLEFPVCVHIYRNPLEVARSLRARNDMPLAAGLALWEAYNVAALAAADGLPRLFVAYHDLMQRPVEVAETLCGRLRDYGGYPLRQPSANELAAFLSTSLHHQRATIDALQDTATDAQVRLFTTLEDLRDAGLRSRLQAPALSLLAIQTLRKHERQRRDVADSVRDANAARMRRQHADAETRLLLKSHELDRALGDLRQTKQELRQVRDDRGRLRNERSRQQRRLAVLDEQVRSLTAARRELIDEAARQAAARHDVRRELGDSIRELAVAKADLVHETAAAVDLRRELDGMVEANARLQQEVGDLQRAAADARRRLANHRELQAVASQMRARVAQLHAGVAALLASRRWRLGHALLSLPHRLLLRPPPPTGADALLALTAEPLPVAVGARAPQPVGAEVLQPPQEAPSRTVAQLQRTTIAVLAWDAGHNPYGRAYLIAEALSRQYRVVLIGFQFPRYGDEVWAPLRGAPIQPVVLPGKDFPAFQQQLESLATRIDPDVVIACKARLPTVQLGLMLKAVRNRPLIVDVDDYEPSFFAHEDDTEGIADQSTEALRVPHAGAWTRHVETLLPYADALLVSNPALQSKFGGVVVPHARDEDVFDPASVDGAETRRQLGFEGEDRLVFFVGTPRPHKGLLELVAAIGASGVANCRLVVVGTPPDGAFGHALASAGGNRLVMVPDQPFDALPGLLAAADLVCLLQDGESPISQFQLPAKVVDALAMGVPVLATSTPPLEGLIAAGLVQATALNSAPAAIAALLAMSPEERKRRTRAARRWFLEHASYRAIRGDLSATIERALAVPKNLPDSARRFLREQEQRFRAPRPAVQRRGGIDIAMFWKQNDVGLYGRRFEMIVEYLRGRSEIGRIALFEPPVPDNPVGAEAPATDQLRILAHKRLLRRWRLMDSENVSYHSGPKDGNGASRRKSFEDYVATELAMLRVDPQRAVFWHYPYFEHSTAVNAALRPRLKLVDVVDDQRTWADTTPARRDLLDRHYREVLGAADIVLANCEEVARSMATMARDILVVPNGCDTRPAPEAPQDSRFRHFAALPRPVVGVVGNLEPKTDSALLRKLALERPAYQLALIGSTHAAEPDLLRLSELPNVTFFGVVTYPEVRAWVSRLDVALVPHRDTEQTRAMHPLKVLVYAAESVPVVATAIENLGDFAPLMRVASSAEDFVAGVDEVVEGRFRVAKEALRAAVQENSWERRVDQIMAAVAARLR